LGPSFRWDDAWGWAGEGRRLRAWWPSQFPKRHALPPPAVLQNRVLERCFDFGGHEAVVVDDTGAKIFAEADGGAKLISTFFAAGRLGTEREGLAIQF
jgi:hypothetical protein